MRMVIDWPSMAACRNGDPDALFVQGAEQNVAKRICRSCPVRYECLADALDNRIVARNPTTLRTGHRAGQRPYGRPRPRPRGFDRSRRRNAKAPGFDPVHEIDRNRLARSP